MNKKDFRIIYMGTPHFAVAPLRELLNHGYPIAAVVTVADKPAGRGRKLRPSPVKEFALEYGLKVLQPLNLKDPAFISELKKLKPDLAVVVAFRMLPESVWSLPSKGTVNLHASLLPQYRGAAPINHAIINGESETGVTTFFIEKEIDTGSIILQKKIPIGPDETAGELHDKLMDAGAGLIIETIELIRKGEVNAIDQSLFNIPENQLKKAPKIFKQDCKIDWSQSIDKVYNFIRGLSPFPGAFTYFNLTGEQKMLKIFKGKKIENIKGKPGEILVRGGKLIGYTADAALELTEIQLEGKKRMRAEDFLRGLKI